MPSMTGLKAGLARVRRQSAYETFEDAIMSLITLAIVLIVIGAAWHLVTEMISAFLLELNGADNQPVFQHVFGLTFTILIALEFKRSILVVSHAAENVVRVRSIVLIAMLATVRKFIVLDIATIDVPGLIALAAAILSLGIVYWLVSTKRALDE